MRYIILLLILTSCDCNYHLSKAEKKCGKVSRTDTLIVNDTIKVDAVRIDTIIYDYERLDTVYITKDRLKIKYFKRDSLIYISGQCDSIYIDRIVKVPCESVELQFDWLAWLRSFWWIILITVLALIGVVYRRG